MKVVIVSNRDLKGGGAYLAALRLTRALRSQGIDAFMLVKEKQSSEDFVVSVTAKNWLRRVQAFLLEYGERLYLFSQIRLKKDRFNFSLGRWGLPIHRHPLIRSADIVHLHWISKSFVSLDTIEELSRMGKRLVWTMHDMWAFTGGCHYSGTCNKYQSECSYCPLLKRPSSNDHSNSVWKRKSKLYDGVVIEGVTCSTWLEMSARQSALWPDDHIRTINNAIDTDFFSPEGSLNSQKGGSQKRDLLFIARHIDDHRKGIDLLKDALEVMVEQHPETANRCRLVIGGEYHDKMTFPVETEYIGFISDAETIKEAYLDSDIFVLPSREDNLPNTLVEASACGLASVAFSVGGIPEMIKHETSGYLVPSLDVAGFAESMAKLVMCDLETLLSFKRASRDLALAKYSPKAVAQRYIKVYKA